MEQYDELDKYLGENKASLPLFPLKEITKEIYSYVMLRDYIKEEYEFWKVLQEGEFHKIFIYYHNANSVVDKIEMFLQKNQIPNAIDHLNKLVILLINNNVLPMFYSQSPEAQFLKKLYSEDKLIADGAFEYFFKDAINGDSLRKSLFLKGVLSAMLFRDIDVFLNNKTASDLQPLETIKNSYLKDIAELKKVFFEKSTELSTTVNILKDDTKNWIDSIKADYGKSNLEKQQAYDDIIKSRTAKFDELEHTYKEKLKLEGPAKYWEELYNEYQDKGKWWRRWAVVSSVMLTSYLSLVLYKLPKEFVNTETFSHQNLKGTILLAVIISVFVYLIRLFVKLSTSAYHLSRDARERHQLTFFYLAMINNANTIQDKDREIILNSLFSRADTGLLKGDSTPAFPGGLLETFIKNIK